MTARPRLADPLLLAWRLTTVVWWLNVALTTRWADVPGAVHGPKRPWVLLTLVVFTLGAWWPWAPTRSWSPRASAAVARVVLVAGLAVLAAAWVTWFPPSTWDRIPILDDWSPRLQSTREFLEALSLGRASAWQWSLLGGYHTSSDVTQSLGLLAWLPMSIAGDLRGFHLLHLCLFAAMPWLVWRDLSLDTRATDPRALAVAAAGVTAVLAAGYSFMLVRSGDTNSLAGALLVLSSLAGAHAARRRRRWGAAWLMLSLTLVAWSHAGSFVYALVYLTVDAALARDWRSGRRAVVAAIVAQIAVLPMTWESWRYPSLFHFNNLYFTPPDHIDWTALVTKVGYNIELLVLPGRWANDYGALALVLLPVTLAVAVIDRSRARFYAVAALVTVAMMRLNDPHFGYAFIRPIHMFPLLLGPVIVTALWRFGRPTTALAGVVAVAVYLQIWWQPVPHVTSMRDVNAPLVDRVAAAPGALVLVENNPHRNTNGEPGGETARSLTGNHYEALLAHETGRRLYAGYWDGWQWSPWRGQMLSGGTWQGRAIGRVPVDEFITELNRWGIVDLFVWSAESTTYLQADSRFVAVWRDGPWTQFRRDGVDAREVRVTAGTASLSNRSPAGARVSLSGVPVGETVVVLTNFHPAWHARVNGRALPLHAAEGLLAFDAPCAGDCIVELVYPARPVLWWLAALALAAGLAWTRYDVDVPRSPSESLGYR